MQSTSVVLMVRPVKFGYNEQTAVSNAFQEKPAAQTSQITDQALAEFDAMVTLLRQHGVEVLVLDDTTGHHTPDAVFPNNWISFHQEQGAVLYPMEAPNRRLERRADLPQWLQQQQFEAFRIFDMSPAEAEGIFLEGTGSMVLDRVNRICYACRSARTHPELLKKWSERMGYEVELFSAVDQSGTPVYHTNVLMAIGEKVAVICLDSIPEKAERKNVRHKLESTGHEIVEITLEQMGRFAGNMLELHNQEGKRLMLMSAQAFSALTEPQLAQIRQYAEIVHPDISTIERYGGGSVRCMMAEVFLPRGKAVENK